MGCCHSPKEWVGRKAKTALKLDLENNHPSKRGLEHMARLRWNPSSNYSWKVINFLPLPNSRGSRNAPKVFHWIPPSRRNITPSPKKNRTRKTRSRRSKKNMSHLFWNTFNKNWKKVDRTWGMAGNRKKHHEIDHHLESTVEFHLHRNRYFTLTRTENSLEKRR